MQMEEEVQKRAAEYRKMGKGAAEAEKMAAEDVALQRQAAAARQAAGQESPEAARVTGLIQTSLASVGGGGVSIRQYENQSLKVARNTEQNTLNLFKTAEDILTAIKERSVASVTTLS